ncbi:PREDICTED: CMP-N-acetylneuraminate-beta-1,4-galactoside alpha-2,3-sialyltransferase isoform X5 [Condylura cristata]|uniref:CMP-N-acetylneuraminate-beta-1,4-galactoside alpha-2,3-sialyltransferase isoform X5 n=1 Tax=Condylura cristata TaxID=143302 RepID=UPI00064303B7|nr:PREDICTED: CMP-N-acetylneuraminate-beta-1,4-galactoside alpha-2,3-sialyltransferase isoform X5 [Condylura cristata]
MGLLVFVRNLLLALCLFLVLGFLYYSAWKLHFLQWEDSKYDRLGFLLKLDSKLPAELATKYANFSEGACKPGYASALMTAIFPRFSKPAPMFLDDSFRKWARIREFVPPFGIKGQVLDAQYSARERVSAEAGESAGHHRSNQRHLRWAQHAATESRHHRGHAAIATICHFIGLGLAPPERRGSLQAQRRTVPSDPRVARPWGAARAVSAQAPALGLLPSRALEPEGPEASGCARQAQHAGGGTLGSEAAARIISAISVWCIIIL